MKKLILICLCSILILTIVGCNSGKAEPTTYTSRYTADQVIFIAMANSPQPPRENLTPKYSAEYPYWGNPYSKNPEWKVTIRWVDKYGRLFKIDTGYFQESTGKLTWK